MTDVLFQIVTYAGAPLWALMIFLPHWWGTRWVISSPYFLLPWVALYALLVVPGLPEILPLILQPKLDAIVALLAKPEAALIGWIHFVAFDLFVGRWIYLDSRERGTSAWLVSPILFLTLLLGPLGLLAYLLLRLAIGPVAREGES
jgi:hypothetical protein